MGSTVRSPRVRARVTPNKGQGVSLVPLYTRESVSLSDGRAVQIDLRLSRADALGTWCPHLKLQNDKPPSSFAFEFSFMPLHDGDHPSSARAAHRADLTEPWQGLTLVHFSALLKRFLWYRGCT